jgi:hypothetical protein
MGNLTPFGWLFVAWGVITAVLVVLLVYRAVVGMKEDDQLFLDPAESALEAEQAEIRSRLDHLAPYVKGLSFASGGLLVAMAGWFVYNTINAFRSS